MMLPWLRAEAPQQLIVPHQWQHEELDWQSHGVSRNRDWQPEQQVITMRHLDILRFQIEKCFFGDAILFDVNQSQVEVIARVADEINTAFRPFHTSEPIALTGGDLVSGQNHKRSNCDWPQISRPH